MKASHLDVRPIVTGITPFAALAPVPSLEKAQSGTEGRVAPAPMRGPSAFIWSYDTAATARNLDLLDSRGRLDWRSLEDFCERISRLSAGRVELVSAYAKQLPLMDLSAAARILDSVDPTERAKCMRAIRGRVDPSIAALPLSFLVERAGDHDLDLPRAIRRQGRLIQPHEVRDLLAQNDVALLEKALEHAPSLPLGFDIVGNVPQVVAGVATVPDAGVNWLLAYAPSNDGRVQVLHDLLKANLVDDRDHFIAMRERLKASPAVSPIAFIASMKKMAWERQEAWSQAAVYVGRYAASFTPAEFAKLIEVMAFEFGFDELRAPEVQRWLGKFMAPVYDTIDIGEFCKMIGSHPYSDVPLAQTVALELLQRRSTTVGQRDIGPERAVDVLHAMVGDWVSSGSSSESDAMPNTAASFVIDTWGADMSVDCFMRLEQTLQHNLAIYEATTDHYLTKRAATMSFPDMIRILDGARERPRDRYITTILDHAGARLSVPQLNELAKRVLDEPVRLRVLEMIQAA